MQRTPDPRASEGTLVVLPTYEEGENITAMLRALREHLPMATVLVIDDASPDGTAELAKQFALSDSRVVVQRRAGKLGLGTAHRLGLQYAVDSGFRTAVTMDADLSHRPADAPRLVLRARQPDVDVVVGSRYVPGGRIEGWPPARRLLSANANLLLRLSLGIGIRDCTGAFRAYDVGFLRRLPLDQLANAGYSALPELLLLAAAAGATIVEEPITFVERRAGATKLTRRELGNSLLNVAHLYRRRRALRHSPEAHELYPQNDGAPRTRTPGADRGAAGDGPR